MQTTNQLVGGLHLLVGDLQTTNQTTNQLVGGLQTANQLGKVGEWVGSGRGSSRLVQNDQRSCRNVFKQVLAKDSFKNNEKHDFSYFSPCLGSHAGVIPQLGFA